MYVPRYDLPFHVNNFDHLLTACKKDQEMVVRLLPEEIEAGSRVECQT